MFLVLAQVHLLVGDPLGISEKLLARSAAQVHRFAHDHGHALAAQYQAGNTC